MPRKKKQPENTPETPVEDTPVRRRRTLPKVEETPVVPDEGQETPEAIQEAPEVTEREPETLEDELEILDSQPDPEFVEPPEEPEEETEVKPELAGELTYGDPLWTGEGPAPWSVPLATSEEELKRFEPPDIKGEQLEAWKDEVKGLIEKRREDPMKIHTLPFPVESTEFRDPLEGPARPKYTRYTRRRTWKGEDRYGDGR